MSRRLRPAYLVKAAVSLGLMAVLIQQILARQDLDVLRERLMTLRPGWVVLALFFQLVAVASNIGRWDALLRGQGLVVPLRHLVGSFLIGRFVGSFTPGTLGLDGYRAYDVARHSGQMAKSLSAIVVEKVIGFFVLSILVMAGTVFGGRYLPVGQLVLLAGVFAVPACGTFLLLLRPTIFRRLQGLVPRKLRGKLDSAVAAVSAYAAERRRLVRAVLFGVPVHLSLCLIYYCCARAFGIRLGVGEALFVGILVTLATVVPLSIAGIGVREGASAFLLGRVGVALVDATLTGSVVYLVGEAVSLAGALVVLVRGANYRVAIAGARAQPDPPIASAATGTGPSPWTEIAAGAAAGLVAGALVGLAEAAVVLAQAAPPRALRVVPFSILLYGIGVAVAGALCALSWRVVATGLGLARAKPQALFSWLLALLLAGGAAAVVRFRIVRDLFHESLPLVSARGLLIHAALAVGFVAVVWLLRRPATHLYRPRWLVAGYALVVAIALGVSLGGPGDAGTRRRAAEPEGTHRPNVVLVVVDTVRADHLSSYGYPRRTSPALDRLADRSVLFENAFAQASWTRPSFATILTGRYPSSHRAIYKADALGDDVETLGGLLSVAGYASTGIVTNYNLAPYFNFGRGFDRYRYLEPALWLGADDTSSRLTLYSTFRLLAERFTRRSMQVSRFYRDARETTGEAIAELDRLPADAPYFLFVTYMDPHDPYFRHPYDGTAVARVSTPNPDPSSVRRIVDLYDGEIEFWDRHFGRLIAALERRPDWDRTMVVVTSDHGEEFRDHGGWWHGTTLYDEQLRVPLVVRLPAGEQAGTRVRGWVRLVDVAPTILRFAGVAAPAAMQGGDLFGESAREVFAEEDHEGNRLLSLRQRADGGTEWKLIVANEGNPRGLGERELYRIDLDPREQEDRSARDAAAAHAVGRALGEAAVGAARGASRGRAVELDEGARDRLRSLGYAGGGR